MSKLVHLSGLLALWCGAATLAHAEVTYVDDDGFVSEHELLLDASPSQAYRAMVADVALWWDAEHSYTGQASSFSLADVAGGCFCERAGDIEVEHMRVVNVQRGRLLVMRGGLGPLQHMAVTGSMSFRFVEHEKGTRLEYRYSVAGHVSGGLKTMASAVDQVQLGQLQRLQRYLRTGIALNETPDTPG